MVANSNSKINLTLIKLIFDYIKANHPLALSIPREESVSLTKSLFKRLEITDTELDFSAPSLKTLETLLASYRSKHLDGIQDENTIELLREVAAYVGEVLAQHTNGKWSLLDNTIWGTSIIYEGRWSVFKENKRTKVSRVRYTLVDIAASSWQDTLDGRKPRLYKLYENILKRELKEELTYHS